MSKPTTYTQLVRATSALMRRKGYAGVGLTEILTEAKLPKGSLYYHFPGGKPELAAAATLWAGDMVMSVIDRCFSSADSFADGAAAICREVAEHAIRQGRVSACPVMAILPAAIEEPLLRDAARHVYSEWTSCAARHAARFGVPDPETVALDLHMRLQGAWVLAFADQSEQPLLALARSFRPGLTWPDIETPADPG